MLRLATILPGEMQLFPDDQGHYIELMHAVVLWGLIPARAFRSQGEEGLCSQRLVKLPQVVEADRRLRLLPQVGSQLGVWMQIAQQPIADAALGDAPQPALGRPQRRQRLGLLPHFQHDWEQTGKPADRAREINFSKEVLPA